MIDVKKVFYLDVMLQSLGAAVQMCCKMVYLLLCMTVIKGITVDFGYNEISWTLVIIKT